MAANTLEHQINVPKTHRGRKFLSKREPKIYENDKQTLIIRGAHTGEIVNSFLTDIYLLKKPLVNKLKWKNQVLPFEDSSFIERMCNKYDCSLFVMGMHSKKRPNNIVIGRLHDHEILDMHELGIENYVSMRSLDAKLSLGAKPVLIFSGEAFDEDEELRLLKSILIDLFRGPKVSCVNSSGLGYVIHFIMPSSEKLIMRVQTIKLEELKRPSKDRDNYMENSQQVTTTEALKTPWGSYVQLELYNSAPEVDFVLRRRQVPSEDKWKRSLRVPSQLRPKRDKAAKNRSVDVFGSKVAQIHLQREHNLDKLRPGSSMRTALTGHVKRGFERQLETNKTKGGKRKAVDGNITSDTNAKRQKVK
ncbi:ribosome production factor 2 [Echinococcus multilocularis]|uniref:Ribosome production factor 2 homolog n=1 Tax=Echinococcus multilocularis TaxID=6211 RepID=A0A068Y119_ECHMU|nr:ribosome production factor 2 [Echinococcus multilocularis]